MSEELKYLPDPLTDDEHKILDAKNLAALGITPDTPDYYPFLNAPDWAVIQFATGLLSVIVQHSHDKLGLDVKYGTLKEARTLLRDNPGLTPALEEAWKIKSFRKIRNLEILHRPKETVATAQSRSRPNVLYESFTSPYRGVAVDSFYEYLRANNGAFRTVNKFNHPIYYGQFCSIVQSYGTGKSRLMFELRNKGVAVLYMNIQPATEFCFPVRNPVPTYILTENLPKTAIEYGARCCAFFTALFRTLKDDLCKDCKSTSSAEEAIKQWNDRMCDFLSDHRTHFFDRLADDYIGLLPSFNEAASVEAVRQPNTEMINPSLDDNARDRAAALQMPGWETMMKAYVTMIHALPSLFGQQGQQSDDHPKLLIGVDDADRLGVVHSDGDHRYRPSTIVCRAISLYSAALREMSPAVWVAFASTSLRVGDVAAPRPKTDSARMYFDGELLYPPYCQLGWDQFADDLDEVRAADVAKARHIMNYGRPVWKSIMGVSYDADYMIERAMWKFSGSMATRDQASLRELGQRLALTIALGHSEAAPHVEQAVASHMRVGVTATEDRRWSLTTYPSEPFLSCVAAFALHCGTESFSDALRVLRDKVDSGMVDIGQCGELASRLLWLSAKDLYVRTQHTGTYVRMNRGSEWNQKDAADRRWDVELVHCQMIPILEFFRFVFGGEFWTTANGAEDCFKNAYINFSHWVSMDENISSSTPVGDEISSDEWTLRHWHRTAGVQCCYGQPFVDKMIPIYFKDEDCNDFSCMSQIFISDKASKHANRDDLYNIGRDHPSIGCESSRPWIAILVDMGLKDEDASVSTSFTEQSSDAACLRIYAAGLSVKTYPFFAKCRALHETVRYIVDQEVDLTEDKRLARYLREQLHYGTTRTKAHMMWEGWSGTGAIAE